MEHNEFLAYGPSDATKLTLVLATQDVVDELGAKIAELEKENRELSERLLKLEHPKSDWVPNSKGGCV